MPELPLELCQAIVDEVDANSDLLRLLLVSINFNLAGERRLYRTISFSGKPPPPDVIKRKWGVFERISTCPRVAAHVFHLTFKIQYWSLPPLTSTSVLAEVFLSVSNLKTLHISASSDLHRHFQARVPFLLRTFSFSCDKYTYALYMRTIESFLEAQIELEELDFPANCDLRLAPSSLPKLTMASGTHDFLNAILPGRAVTRVGVRSEGPFIYAGPLRSLLLVASDLELYMEKLSTLHFLEYWVWNYQQIQIQTTYCLKLLSSLKKLKVEIIDLRSGQEEDPLQQKLEFIGSTFAGCPSLCYIEIRDMRGRPLPWNMDSEIWTRDSQIGIPYAWDVDEWKRW